MDKKLLIAIVDDDLIFQFIAERLIESINSEHQTIIFSDGKEAIDFIDSNRNEIDTLPDIIFLDINMPVMNGWQFLNKYIEIKSKIEKEITIYIVSSSKNPDDFIKAENINEVTDYIVKPINREKYTSILDSFCK
ncbi:Response regulator receiver domain-containing protein [Flavobacterium gillisiae]|uniref:Response regulator receiver domain-containing protein n=1 Tax=Flavobacterium gillisiae TaxID=150146 RepID=A0A1H4B0T5_9FLAO|nr:response regulator [Flavobacterium gillisiae]SEA41502.1 Response regulator receiver domain-containing protein [Flavobacterium gillisiae]